MNTWLNRLHTFLLGCLTLKRRGATSFACEVIVVYHANS